MVDDKGRLLSPGFTVAASSDLKQMKTSRDDESDQKPQGKYETDKSKSKEMLRSPTNKSKEGIYEGGEEEEEEQSERKIMQNDKEHKREFENNLGDHI